MKKLLSIISLGFLLLSLASCASTKKSGCPAHISLINIDKDQYPVINNVRTTHKVFVVSE